MRFQRVTLQTCAGVAGVAVVIDVIRAFTTAAYAFAAGAREILPVSTIEQAFALRAELPDALLMGEIGGRPVEGFDLGNSPSALDGRNLSGRVIVQRTTAGTQGIVCSAPRADHVLACSLACASATARTVRRLAPKLVTFVLTGFRAESDVNDGDEDAACADYVEALLRGAVPDAAAAARRVCGAHVARQFGDPAKPWYPVADLDYCAAVDRFDFAMPVIQEGDRLVMRTKET
jgi:2-phosphosulfolactate phosphatase